MTLDIAHLVVMAVAALMGLLVSMLAFSTRSLIDAAGKKMETLEEQGKTHRDRLDEHGKSIAVLQVRTDSIEAIALDNQRSLHGGR